MEIVRYRDAAAFADAARPLYESDPLRHTIALTVLDGLVRTGEAPTLALTVCEEGAVTAAALQTAPWPLACSGVPAGLAGAVAEALAGEDLPGVNGPRPEAEAFGTAWAARTGAQVRVGLPMRLHALGDLIPPRGVPGAGRVAEESDVPLLGAWRDAFAAEERADLPGSRDGQQQVQRGLELGYGEMLWEVDGTPVAQASARAPVAGMSRIGPVYTTPEHRRQGYAAAVTAAASQWALDAGARDVLLFTDAENALTNRLYARLGYGYVHDAVELLFA